MFRVEIHDNSYKYFSNIDLSENALHITSNLSLAKLIKESNRDNKNKRKVINIDHLLESIYPNLNDSLNKNNLKIELRNILISNNVGKIFLQEENINILFSDYMFLIESGIRSIPDIANMTEKEKTVKAIFNKFVESDRVKKIIKEISSSSSLKLKYTFEDNKKVEKIYLYNFNNLHLSRMVFFNRLRYWGYELIFRIPFTNIKNIDIPWINLYSKEYFQWDMDVYKKYENNTRNAFIEYLDGKPIESIDSNIQFKKFAVSYDFKKELELKELKPHDNKKISYYALDTSLVNQIFDIDGCKEYHTPIIRFMDKMYYCTYKDNDIYLSQNLMIDLLTSGWIEIKEGNRNINGIYYLDFLKKLESYFYGIESIEGFLLRLEDLRNLKLASDTMENQIKDKIDRNKVKQFLSNPFRCISSVNIEDYEITILQLKSLVERLRYILKTTIKREDGFVDFNKNNDFLKSILQRNTYMNNLKESNEYKHILTKINRVLNHKTEFQYIHQEDIKELIGILTNEEDNKEKILPLDVIDGNWQRGKFKEIHITDLSFKAYKKYLDSKKMISKYVNYDFINKILLTEDYKKKEELKECLRIAKISANNIEKFLTFDIANLISNYKGKIILSYIENLRDGDSESILLRLLKNLYKKDLETNNILLDYLDDVENEKNKEEITDIATNKMINKSRYICPTGFRDLDFCHNKFVYSSLINSHIEYDSDFHHRLVFVQLICLLRGDIPSAETSIKRFIFPLFPQWNYTTKENMLLTSYFKSPLQEYNLYENINYPKYISRLQVLMSKYSEKYRIKNRYDENKLDTEKEFKEFLKVYIKEEKLSNPGKHCSMCPYILICKEGEYPVERNR